MGRWGGQPTRGPVLAALHACLLATLPTRPSAALPTCLQVAPPIVLPQPGKHGQFRSGLGQKGTWARPKAAAAAAGGGGCCSCFQQHPATSCRCAPCHSSPLWCSPVLSFLHWQAERWMSATWALNPALLAGLAVFLNSLGELTAYDSDGDMLWQVGRTGCKRACKHAVCHHAAASWGAMPHGSKRCHAHPSTTTLPPCCCTPAPCPCLRSTMWAPPGLSRTTRMCRQRPPRCAPCRCAPAPSLQLSWQVGPGWGGF